MSLFLRNSTRREPGDWLAGAQESVELEIYFQVSTAEKENRRVRHGRGGSLMGVAESQGACQALGRVISRLI